MICASTLGRGASWNQKAKIVVAAAYNSGISRVSASGGTPTAITEANNTTYSVASLAVISAGWQTLPVCCRKPQLSQQPRNGGVFASLDGKENRLLFHGFSNAIYVSGHLLYQHDNSLLAQAFDPAAGKFTSEPQTLAENVSTTSACGE